MDERLCHEDVYVQVDLTAICSPTTKSLTKQLNIFEEKSVRYVSDYEGVHSKIHDPILNQTGVHSQM